MAGTISEFAHSFSADVARPSKFDVYIPGSPSLNYRCEISQLPGRHLSTVEQKTYGPFEKFPYHVSYNDIDMTFLVDDNMTEKLFFDKWLEQINPTSSFDIAYKSDYVVDITINQYNVVNEISYSAILSDAYPINVNQLDLDWSNADGKHKLSVTFAYTYWINNSQSPSSPPSDEDSLGLNTGEGDDWE